MGTRIQTRSKKNFAKKKKKGRRERFLRDLPKPWLQRDSALLEAREGEKGLSFDFLAALREYIVVEGNTRIWPDKLSNVAENLKIYRLYMSKFINVIYYSVNKFIYFCIIFYPKVLRFQNLYQIKISYF